jgi:hypothetical protein
LDFVRSGRTIPFLPNTRAPHFIAVKEPELFTGRDCRRCEAQGMKLWYFTANALQQSRCGENRPARRVKKLRLKQKSENEKFDI